MNRRNEKVSLLKHLDFNLILTVLALGLISITAISSAKFNDWSYVEKQITWYVLGFLVLIAMLCFDYRRLRPYAFWLYGFGVFLLLLLHVPGIGVEKKGATSWLNLGFGQFQPSEFMKVCFIFALAKVFAEAKEVIVINWKTLASAFVIFLISFLLIIKEPDLGTALIIFAIFATMLLVGGLDWRIILLFLLILILCVGAVFWLYFNHKDFLLENNILKEHQMKRIDTFLDPTADVTGDSFQVYQAMIAIGSGQLFGKGYQQGTQIQGNWVPESYNDFIFSVIAEEFGFIGVSVLLCLFIYLIYRMVRIALSAQDFFGSYIVAGVIGMIVFQVYQNIGMTVGLMPVTGINLPFISYGGSSLLTMMASVGLVLNIGMRQKTVFSNPDD